MTASKHLPPLHDFWNGYTSDMLRRWQECTAELEKLHARTIAKYGEFKTERQEQEAFEHWKEEQAQKKPKRRKIEAREHKCRACRELYATANEA